MITERFFGRLPSGAVVTAYDLMTESGLSATVLSYGARLQSLIFPDGTDIVLGFDTLDDYLRDPFYFGAVIGPVANRISHAQFTLNDVVHRIPSNEGANNLHSGPDGFDRQNWYGNIKGDSLVLTHDSPAGYQGFPGAVSVRLEFRFVGATLTLNMTVTTRAATPINLTYHPYFNLSGGGTVTDHTLQTFSDHYTPIDAVGLPTGEISAVTSALDFRKAKRISDNHGVDHNFVVSGSGVKKVAKLCSTTTGHKVIICSDAPGLQVYTGAALGKIFGKKRVIYGPYAGVALEPQSPPDSVNHSAFPDIILRAGQTYHRVIKYTFKPSKAPA